MSWFLTGNQNLQIKVSILTEVINPVADLFRNLLRTQAKDQIPNPIQGRLIQNQVPGHPIQNRVPSQVLDQVLDHRIQDLVTNQAPDQVPDLQIQDKVQGLPQDLIPDLQQAEDLPQGRVIQEQDINSFINHI